jgi:hypothetical protein
LKTNRNAPWGEKYFHIREPEGYLISFAETIIKRKGKTVKH